VAKNPFSYGSPVSGSHFAGREVELAALTSRMSNGINVVVTAPRRYGKSSLLGVASHQVGAAGGSIIRANLLRIPNVETLAGRLASEAFGLTGGPWRRMTQAVPEFLKRLRLRPTITLDDAGKPQFTFAPGATPRDAEQLIDDVYLILADLAKASPACLILDEFQAAADLSPRLPALLKALSDEHSAVSLVLAGSRRHLMESLVLAKGAPLYNMAERIALGPVDELVMRRYLQARTKAGGKSMEAQVADAIRTQSGPIPHDIQRLAYEVFDASGTSITESNVVIGMEHVVNHEAEVYAERFSRLALGHRRLLLALAANEVRQPQSAWFVRVAGYANAASVRKAMQVFEQDETVLQRDGVYCVADPFYREWLRRAHS
jgi:hypothetical protein